jgi:hypothetical protein
MGEELNEKQAQTTEAEVQETEVEEVGNADTDDNAEEFSDGGNDEAETADGGKDEADDEGKSWKTEKNAEQARKRREVERQAELKKTRNDAIITALNGVNPYTNEKIEDDGDVDEYLTMKEIEKSGKDPVNDYSKFLKNRAKEFEKAEKAELNKNERTAKDRSEFEAKYPDVKIDDLFKDDLFRAFTNGKILQTPMIEIYEGYRSFQKLSEERAKTKAAQILANNAATPGKLSNQSPPPSKSVDDMTKAEFETMVEKVKRGELKHLK